MSKKGVILTFDFSIEDLKKYYSYTSPKNAYKSIGNYLIKNGFEKANDSDYISYNLSKAKTYNMMKKFSKEQKWFTPSLRKLSITPIDDRWNLSLKLKEIFNDIDFMKQKEQEYNMNKTGNEKVGIQKKSLLNRINSKKQANQEKGIESKRINKIPNKER